MSDLFFGTDLSKKPHCSSISPFYTHIIAVHCSQSARCSCKTHALEQGCCREHVNKLKGRIELYEDVREVLPALVSYLASHELTPKCIVFLFLVLSTGRSAVGSDLPRSMPTICACHCNPLESLASLCIDHQLCIRQGQQLSLIPAHSLACHAANIHYRGFFVEHVRSVLWFGNATQAVTQRLA